MIRKADSRKNAFVYLTKLITRGGNINARDVNGDSVLSKLILIRDDEYVKWAVERGAIYDTECANTAILYRYEMPQMDGYDLSAEPSDDVLSEVNARLASD